jgi:hypothetical protein
LVGLEYGLPDKLELGCADFDVFSAKARFAANKVTINMVFNFIIDMIMSL